MDEQDGKLPPNSVDADEEAKEEKVGYACPLVRTRFKAGKSGNPAGRPRGSRNVSPARELQRWTDTFLQAVDRMIIVNDNGRQTKITVIEAALRSLATKAAKGDFRSQKYMFDMRNQIKNDQEHRITKYLCDAVNYQKEKYAEIEAWKRAGKTPPNNFLHPDDIYIDTNEGTVDIVGPSSWEEKERWDEIDKILLHEAKLMKEIEELRFQLIEVRTGKKAGKLREQFEALQEGLKRIQAITAPMSSRNKARRLRRLAAMAQEGSG